MGNFSGMIEPTAPLLAQYPGGGTGRAPSTSRAVSTQSKKTKEDAPNGMQKQTYDYLEAEAAMDQQSVNLSNQMYSILKNKYHGDYAGFTNDKDVQTMLQKHRAQKSSLVASRNEVETQKVKMLAHEKDLVTKGAEDAYYTNDRDQRMFYDDKGVVRYEGDTYKDKSGKRKRYTISKGSDYLTNQEYTNMAEQQASVRMDANGLFKADTPNWETSVDFTKDAVMPYFTGTAAKAGETGSGGGTKSISAFGDSFMLIQKHGYSKNNHKQIDQMTKAAINNLPVDVRKQLKERYWKQGLDRMNFVSNGNGFSAYTDAQRKSLESDIKSGKSAKELNLSQVEYDAMSDNQFLNDDAKFAMYVQGAAMGITEGMKSSNYIAGEDKFIKRTEAEVGAAYERKRRTQQSAMNWDALQKAGQYETQARSTILVPAGKKGDKNEYLTVDVPIGVSRANSETWAAYAKMNNNFAEAHQDSDGEWDFSTFTSNDAVSARSDYAVGPDGAIITDKKILNSMYIVETSANTYARPKVIKSNGGLTYATSAPKEGEEFNSNTNVQYATGHNSTVAMDYEDFQDYVEKYIITQKLDKKEGDDNRATLVTQENHKNLTSDDMFTGNDLSPLAIKMGFRLAEYDGSAYKRTILFPVHFANNEFTDNTELANHRNTLGNAAAVSTAVNLDKINTDRNNSKIAEASNR